MRHVIQVWSLAAGLGMLASVCAAQAPPNSPAGNPADALVARMMAFDQNKDGQLARSEITDERLLRLFDRADADKSGIVTKEELTAVAAQVVAEGPGAGGRRGGPGGPGGFGPGGPGGRGPGGPPQPGQILPAFLQEQLNLTAEQKQQLAELQKEVDARLGKILTEDQKKQLAEMRERGPRGFGRPGDPGPAGPPERRP